MRRSEIEGLFFLWQEISTVKRGLIGFGLGSGSICTRFIMVCQEEDARKTPQTTLAISVMTVHMVQTGQIVFERHPFFLY